MLITIIIILTILWFLGYAPLSGISIPNIDLFPINNHIVTLWEVLILLVISWAIGILPRPLQTIASILLFFWILSAIGILTILSPNIIVIIIIIALIFSVFR